MGQTKWKRKVRQLVIQHIPFLGWIKNYNKKDAVSDVIAGITISLTMIPQVIAYASLANLSPEYGLNSAFMGTLLYVFFGTIKEVVIGPTSLMALLTFEYTSHLNIDFVILLTFLCGLVELAMGLLRLGFLVEYIPVHVVSGFTSATSVIIATSQVKGIMGIRFKSKSFIDNLRKLYEGITNVRKADMILGVSCICSLLALRSLNSIKVSKEKTRNKILKHLLWFLATGRNAMIVIATSYITYTYISTNETPPFYTTREVSSGIPPFRFPPTSTQIGNKTYNFQEMVRELGSGLIVIPVVSALSNVAIAKAYSTGQVDGTQEMLTLALCNILGSTVQSMPTCGAFTRSAVISASGVRTPLAGLYSSCLTLMALKYLASHFHLIPRATLSAVLISAVIFLFDYRIFKPLWKSSLRDSVILVVTMVSCLGFGVEIGLLVGVICAMMYLVYLWSKPPISCEVIQSAREKFLKLTPHLGLYYPSADYFHNYVTKNCQEHEDIAVVIDCAYLTGVDYTSLKRIHALTKSFERRRQRMVFINVPSDMIQMWKNSGCGKLNMLNSANFEQKLFGALEEETLIFPTDSEVHQNKENAINDKKYSLHEEEELLGVRK